MLGDVAFQDCHGLEKARERHLEIWDDEEEYLAADEIKTMFPSWQIKFLEILLFRSAALNAL
ncbi:MAG: hypothetical protein GX335_03280 [Firmicutes bacterium]|nr:hypothetical protein [Bacillota bacterium]